MNTKAREHVPQPANEPHIVAKGHQNGAESAWPNQAQSPQGLYDPSFGLTKREYIATALCAGMLSDPCRAGPFADFVHRAIKCTDLLLEELAK